MRPTFTLTNDTAVFLYGAASVGKLIYQRNPALHICGFIDMRAEELHEFMGLPVYSPEQAVELDKESVLIISVKNVFEHEDIAASLNDAGFDKLIYKSNAVLRGQGGVEEARLSETWDMLMEGRVSFQADSLCRFQKSMRAAFSDHLLISEREGPVLSYIPVELIYTNLREEDPWADLNIQGYYPHIFFFFYLSNHQNGQTEDYVKFAEETAQKQGDIKITGAWRRNVIRNRTDVYEHMRASLDMDPGFFYRNASTAVWNEKGYFNLTSGKHRCAFLVSQGYRYIPLKIPAADYQKFLKNGNPDSLRKSIEERGLRCLDVKTYHPWFCGFPCTEPPYYSYFQVEALCRTIRCAMERGRSVLLYTNLPEENSLHRLLRGCRLVEMTDAETAEILLLDAKDAAETSISEPHMSEAVIWRIDFEMSGHVFAQYVSKLGNVYFFEDRRKLGG